MEEYYNNLEEENFSYEVGEELVEFFLSSEDDDE